MGGLDSYIVLFVSRELCYGCFCFKCEGFDPVPVFVAEVILQTFVKKT